MAVALVALVVGQAALVALAGGRVVVALVALVVGRMAGQVVLVALVVGRVAGQAG